MIGRGDYIKVKNRRAEEAMKTKRKNRLQGEFPGSPVVRTPHGCVLGSVPGYELGHPSRTEWPPSAPIDCKKVFLKH